MSDHRIRILERRVALEEPGAQAALFAMLLRAGEKKPGARNTLCVRDPCDEYMHVCHDWEDRSVGMLPWLRLRAYCGDNVARAVLGCTLREWTDEGKDAGWHQRTWEWVDAQEQDKWLRRLWSLIKKLPDVAISVACEDCAVLTLKPLKDACWSCAGTGVTTTPAVVYLAACIGLAVGWVAGNAWCLENCAGQYLHECLDLQTSLKMHERWTWCPCPVNLEAWRVARLAAGPNLFWLTTTFYDQDLISGRLRIAAKLIGEEDLRKAAQIAVLGAL